MQSFIIKELHKELEISSFDINNGFQYKIREQNDLNVKEIMIFETAIIDSLIMANFNKRYKKILEYYFSILQDDDNSTDGKLVIALDEIARLRSILIRKYHIYLSKKAEEKMFKKLKILENEIRTKIIDYKLIKEQELTIDREEEKGRGR